MLVDLILKAPDTKKGVMDAQGYNALYYATLYGHLNIIKFLQQNEVSYKPNKKGITCLHVAARKGYYDIVDYFLSHIGQHISDEEKYDDKLRSEKSLSVNVLWDHIDPNEARYDTGVTAAYLAA